MDPRARSGVRPAADARPADWLLAAQPDWASLARFGPPGYAAHLRIAFRFSGVDEADQAVGRTFAVLATHTSTPGHCHAAIWEGWGGGPPAPVAPVVPIPHRTSLLFEGPVVALPAAVHQAWDAGDSTATPPHLAWPDDHAWVFACDVDEDLEFSVGCSRAAAEELMAALPAQARPTPYAAPAPLWADTDVWPLACCRDFPRWAD